MDERFTMKSDRRNLHLHRAAMARLRERPELRARCLSLLERWIRSPELAGARVYLQQWRELLLHASDEELERVTLDPDGAQALRSCSPLGPVFTPRERWALLREVNDGLRS